MICLHIMARVQPNGLVWSAQLRPLQHIASKSGSSLRRSRARSDTVARIRQRHRILLFISTSDTYIYIYVFRIGQMVSSPRYPASGHMPSVNPPSQTSNAYHAATALLCLPGRRTLAGITTGRYDKHQQYRATQRSHLLVPALRHAALTADGLLQRGGKTPTSSTPSLSLSLSLSLIREGVSRSFLHCLSLPSTAATCSARRPRGLNSVIPMTDQASQNSEQPEGRREVNAAAEPSPVGAAPDAVAASTSNRIAVSPMPSSHCP
ncbi:hypothetical protein BC628DRAFT_264362 [Trametes gibbosa]|nr:hypothetical protein BC628DRAFT_264362 [Trametes gibbosa]